jgi:hypothetical protein
MVCAADRYHLSCAIGHRRDAVPRVTDLLPGCLQVYKLMMPHWAFTMQINANARSSLINAGGIIEQCFTPGSYAMEVGA